MRTAGRIVVIGWLLAALTMVGLNGELLALCAWATPGSLLVLVASAVVRQQSAPSILDQLPFPERYRVADDLTQPLAAVVAVAEQEATAEWQRAR